MFCTRCGLDLQNEARFCSRCGNRNAPALVAAAIPSQSLMLDKRHKKIGGVCAGFARYFDVDLTLMRVLWLGISLATGIGFIVYLAAWAVIPSDYGQESQVVVQTSGLPREI